MDRFVASSSTAGQPPRQLSSIDDVQRWLRTLTEATSTQKLESVRASVNVLKKPDFKTPDARALCKIWPVKQDRGKQRPLTQVILELKEHVIKAANELRADLFSMPAYRFTPSQKMARPCILGFLACREVGEMAT